MDPVAVFFAAISIFIFGSITLGVYAYGLHQIGTTLAYKQKWQGEIWRGASRICLWCLPILALGPIIPVHPIYQVCISMCVYIFHAQPLCVGYWSERIRLEKAEELRFKKNVDDWLSEWECRETNTPGE